MLHRKLTTRSLRQLIQKNSWTRLLTSILLGSETVFPRHCRLPIGGGLVLVWRFRVMSAAIGDFRLSNSDTTELEAALPSLSESKVSLLDTELSGLLHVQKVNSACSSTVYSALHSLRPATYYSGNYARLIASRFGSELYGWSMAFLRKLVTCARKWV